MGIAAQRRWRERGVVKSPAPREPGLPAIISRQFHQDAIQELTRKYELQLSELRKKMAADEPKAEATEEAKKATSKKAAKKATSKKD